MNLPPYKNKPTFSDVVEAWDKAPEADIHPLWQHGESYWESGRYQASQVAQWAKKGSTVLDFGCGNGRLSIPLAQAGYTVIAVDSSAAMLQRLKTYADKHKVKIRTVLSDGLDLSEKLGGEKVGTVVCRSVLIHHDYASTEKIVQGIGKVVAKKGHFIADWPLDDNPRERDTWISVTTWRAQNRLAVAAKAGFKPVFLSDQPTVWQKKS